MTYAAPGPTVHLHTDDPVLERLIDDAIADGSLLVEVSADEGAPFVPMFRDGEVVRAKLPYQAQRAVERVFRMDYVWIALRNALRPYGLVPEQIEVPTFVYAFRETNDE